MKSIRIGNDINVAWSLMRDDAPFLLDKETISLFLQTPFGRMELTDYSVEGNVISWVFFGKNQKAIGKYSLILVINKGKEGMITTDACDFVNLVSCSCKTGGSDGCGVETEYVNLVSKVDVGGSGGGSSYDDTELRNEIARVDDKLTELSAEVSGLSEKIENLPSGESSVFKAVYGTTTIEEVTEAYNAGKVIHCDYDGKCYVLSGFASGQAFFTCVSSTYMFRLELKQDSRWAIATFNYENSSNKTKTINKSSTDTQYPSAKAVYDFVNTTLGLIINGDY